MAKGKLAQTKSTQVKPVHNKTQKREAEEEAKSRSYIQSDFPKDTLEEATRVARAIEDANGGQPLPPIETATALGISPGSSDFRVLLSSSLKYGLTNGSYKSDRISLENLGRQIVEPKNAEEREAALIQAALRPSTFLSIYNYYKGKKIPEASFFQNAVVRDFSVPREHAEKCVAVFLSNMDFAGLIRATTGGRWLSTDARSSRQTPASEADTADDDATTDLDSESSGGKIGRLPVRSGVASGAASEQDAGTARGRPEGAERRVFITHGNDKSFVDPIKKLLGFGELVPVVSVERQTVSKPVPEKVMDDMRTCGAAIIHVDAERILIDKDANEHTVINPNVLIEIGAAMALFGRRFILLVRDGIKLPSNLQGLYEVRYKGETLDGDATIRLLEAINDIKKNPLPG